MQDSVRRPRFLYFDLGMVMVTFSLERMCRQMAAAAGVSPQAVRHVLLETPLQTAYETGRLSTREYYEEFCRLTHSQPDCDALVWAATDIFELNYPIVALASQLRQAGYRLGVLSNTCVSHWEHCYGRFRFLRDCFSVHALSFELHVMKPDAEIFLAAAKLAGVAPAEMFFVDDLAGHVVGARAVGVDAVQYTTVAELAAALRTRGLRFNY